MCVPLFLSLRIWLPSPLGIRTSGIAQPDEDTAAVFGQDSDGGLGLGLDSIIFLLFPVIRQEPNEGKDNLAIYSLTFCETETLMLDAEHSCRHVVCSVSVQLFLHPSSGQGSTEICKAWFGLVHSPCLASTKS